MFHTSKLHIGFWICTEWAHNPNWKNNIFIKAYHSIGMKKLIVLATSNIALFQTLYTYEILCYVLEKV